MARSILGEIDCGYISASWEPVPGAASYSVEITVEYDSTSLDCENPPDRTFIYTFSP